MSSFRLTRQAFLRAAAAGIGPWPVSGRAVALAADDPVRVGDPLPLEMQKAWTARQGRWGRIFCEVSGYTVVSKEALAGIPNTDLVPVDQIQNVRFAIWIDMEARRLRMESRPGDHDRAWKVILHDGNRLRVQDRNEKTDDRFGVGRDLFEYRYWPILFGHGIVGGPEGWLAPANLRRAYDRKNYEVAAADESLVTIRSKPFSGNQFVMEYDIDPAQEGLVVASRFLAGRREPRLPEGELRVTEVREGMPAKWTYRSTVLRDFLQIDRREMDPDFSKVVFQLDER